LVTNDFSCPMIIPLYSVIRIFGLKIKLPTPLFRDIVLETDLYVERKNHDYNKRTVWSYPWLRNAIQ
jgi:hypothetical protein